jgi:serine/threonine protein kinase
MQLWYVHMSLCLANIPQPYYEQGDLATFITHYQQLHPQGFSQSLVLDMTTQLISVIKLLHTNNTIHRDISPDNIIISQNGSHIQFILSDFECGREIDDDGRYTKGLGKIAYCAPEMITGKYGFAIDIWMLGVVMYEVMALQKVTSGAPYLSQIICDKQSEKKQHDLMRMRLQLRGMYDNALIELVMSMLQFNPCARPSHDQILQTVTNLTHCTPIFDVKWMHHMKQNAKDMKTPTNVLLLGADKNVDTTFIALTSALRATASDNSSTSNTQYFAQRSLDDSSTGEKLNITFYEACMVSNEGCCDLSKLEYILKGCWEPNTSMNGRNWNWFYHYDRSIDVVILCLSVDKNLSSYIQLIKDINKLHTQVIVCVTAPYGHDITSLKLDEQIIELELCTKPCYVIIDRDLHYYEKLICDLVEFFFNVL